MAEEQAMKDFLRTLSLFEGLEDSDIETIATVVKKMAVARGTVICKEGGIGDAFYVLNDGEVNVSKNNKVVNTIKSTDESNFFGEMALIENLPRNATISARTDCVILEIEKKNFDLLLRVNSFIALRIMTALTRRLRMEVNPGKSTLVQETANVITFFSPKGGAGKTTIATNVACGMAKYLKKKVLLIDLDLQFGGIAFMLGLKVKRSIVNLTEPNSLSTYEDVKTCLVRHSSGFDLLPAPIRPEQSENIDSTHLRKIIALCKPNYNYIIIDTHSLLQDMTINALDLSDIIMLLMNPDMGHIVAIHNCLKVMDSLKYPKEKIRLLLNRYGSVYSKSKNDMEDFLRKVNYVIHDNWKMASDLVNDKRTAFDSDKVTSYKSDIVNLINDLTGETMPPEAGEVANKTVFTKIVDWFNT